MRDRDALELKTQWLGALPVVNWFCDRLGLDELLERFVPANDRRLRLAPAAALGVVVRNLLVDHEPVYTLGEWARSVHPLRELGEVGSPPLVRELDGREHAAGGLGAVGVVLDAPVGRRPKPPGA